jgi:homoserine/homoserine lactone efflux protein
MMFALTELALSAAPGPAVLFVVSQGLRCRSGRALWAALGILAANALYFAVSGTGVGALLVTSQHLFTVVKWAGAAYLLYLGTTALLRPPSVAGRGEAASGAASRRPTLFLRGIVLQLSNPKALLFFVAILPQFIDRGRPIVPQILILGITSILLEFLVLTTYASAAARAARVAMQPRFVSATRRLGGALLVGAALGLARLER